VAVKEETMTWRDETDRLFIAGEWTSSTSPDHIEVVSPTT
jgi:hypothetical protein